MHPNSTYLKKMNQCGKKIIFITGLCLACVTGLVEAKSKDKKPTTEELDIALEQMECSGPKPRVAIYGFYATGKMAAFEGYNIGDGLAAQLATELTRTGCFIVLDRTGLSDVLREQELGLAGIVNRESAPAAGRMVGADVLIKGSITEFDPNKKGGGLTLGFASRNNPFGLRLGRNKSTAHVGLDISIIDATNGQVKFSHRVSADSKTGGWTLGLDYKQASVGGDNFAKSPLGIASRNALGQAVLEIAQDITSNIQPRFQVASFDLNEVYLNASLASGIHEGDVFKVSTVVRVLVDPATGMLMDTIEREVGEVRIIEVTDRYSRAELLAEEMKVKRGDFVHL